MWKEDIYSFGDVGTGYFAKGLIKTFRESYLTPEEVLQHYREAVCRLKNMIIYLDEHKTAFEDIHDIEISDEEWDTRLGYPEGWLFRCIH